MEPLSRNTFAPAIGVSRHAVAHALKRGWLIADPDGRIDPRNPPNDLYWVSHICGFDSEGRDMRTHRGPRQGYLPNAPGELGGNRQAAALDVDAYFPEKKP